jgi:hypothetical protein
MTKMDFRNFMETDKLVSDKTARVPLYYGCKNDVGHMVWGTNGSYLPRHKGEDVSFLAHKDGQLAPKDSGKAGRAILHRWPGFSIVAYWDYAVDSRPGSNSMFFLPGRLSPSEAVAEIERYFPEIWLRSPATIVKEEDHE